MAKDFSSEVKSFIKPAVMSFIDRDEAQAESDIKAETNTKKTGEEKITPASVSKSVIEHEKDKQMVEKVQAEKENDYIDDEEEEYSNRRTAAKRTRSEKKDKRFQMLMRPSLFDEVCKQAQKEERSAGSLINAAIVEYLENHKK